MKCKCGQFRVSATLAVGKLVVRLPGQLHTIKKCKVEP